MTEYDGVNTNRRHDVGKQMFIPFGNDTSLEVIMVDEDDWDEDDDGDHSQMEHCPTCGGDGIAEYNDCPEAWGEDCPSEVNHLITCPNCGGSGKSEDAAAW